MFGRENIYPEWKEELKGALHGRRLRKKDGERTRRRDIYEDD